MARHREHGGAVAHEVNAYATAGIVAAVHRYGVAAPLDYVVAAFDVETAVGRLEGAYRPDLPGAPENEPAILCQPDQFGFAALGGDRQRRLRNSTRLRFAT